MPAFETYELHFHSGLHLGTRGVNLEEAGVHVPSDTLVAALLDTWRHAGGDATRLGETLATDPPWLVTSAFPFAGPVRFFPMPASLSRIFSSEILRQRRKEIKRIRYLSEALMRLALGGASLDEWLFPVEEHAEPKRGAALQEGALWLTVDEASQLPMIVERHGFRLRALRHQAVWSTSSVPRVTIHRSSSASTVFQSGRTSFSEGCGLWFGVQWVRPDSRLEGSEATYSDALRNTLAMLGDAGIGGERSAGYGGFVAKSGTQLVLPDPDPGRPAWLLSRYHPREDELPDALANPEAAYNLVSVGGWLRSPDGLAQRRKQLYLVAEGSIVCPPAWPAGDVVDVRPTYENPAGDMPHPVYRYGLALGAGMGDTKEDGRG